MEQTSQLEASDVSELQEDLQNVSLEDIQHRHRKERKDLQAKIQALKKTAPKKKRKEIMEEVERLEKQLEKQQSQEIDQFKQNLEKPKKVEATSNCLEDNNEKQEEEEQQQQQRVSRAQKRRDKKAKEAKEREDRLQADLENMINSPKIIEMQNLEEKLEKRHLALFHIKSDGDCLYNAVRHQLIQHGLGYYTTAELRSKAASYIESNKATLLPYMTNSESDNILSDEEFNKYCHDTRYTSVWGGQIELKALSSSLRIPIEVIQAEGSSTIQGKDYNGSPLVITYHRHMYSMGEHYNSTFPLAEMTFVSDECDDQIKASF